LITEQQIVLRLLGAAVLGGLVGLERERHNQPAGLRTHIILAIGAALAMCVSIDLAMQFQPYVPNGDPARLAAQVISGIGFLGAGAIFKYGTGVKGLTTATSLWTIAIVGLAVGAGHYFPAAVATALLLIALSALDALEKKYLVSITTRRICMTVQDKPLMVDELKQVFQDLGMEIKSVSISKDVESNELEFEALAKVSTQQDMDKLIGKLSHIHGVRTFEIQ
jgi:putative Mg2+ transporter-C (MgtC) family protein